jgi:hypothetical protein
MKGKRRPRHSGKKGDAAQIAAQLAPLEEQNRDAARKQGTVVEGTNQGAGAIVIDKRDLHLPKGMNEVGETETSLGIEPVVIVIVILMLAYIAFIAWQVSQMPANL